MDEATPPSANSRAVLPPTPAAIALVEDGGELHFRTDPGSLPLYTFDDDTAGRSNCTDRCVLAWRPFAASVDARPVGDWSPIIRNDGSPQWAYRGKPVYTYAGDSDGGAATGNGKDGVWRVLPGLPSP